MNPYSDKQKSEVLFEFYKFDPKPPKVIGLEILFSSI